MSTIKTTNLSHGSNSGTANVVLDSSGNTTLNGNLTVTGTVPPSITYKGTAVASTSGTSVEFTGIPAAATRLTLILSAVGTNGSEDLMVQLGHSGGYYTSNYNSCAGYITGSSASETGVTDCFNIQSGDASAAFNIIMQIMKVTDADTSAEWVASYSGSDRNAYWRMGGGGLTGVSADIVKLIVKPTGSNAFDAGKMQLTWEY